ncbi:GGDEF domain-containing protein [Pseudomonas sp. HMWF032]|uniref:sensor domain-containing diguanylate cyclase n=1 Tax=Pseudomonas sp. HMWF032 TaxID=2056866 RepID=UPI000D386A8C|nr:sensor domain-containing diguanylate cyclase [Pseudomonas sp. HMWF032]PTS85971.1 GGDEF domain-containing protein [Pseudomonas sp. HMWF032]PTT79520.1 GGDEF domain-containing protein [Pseudomonas sp. HMWF010]
MLSPEMPCDEVLRQQILDDNELLDTPADPYLDTLVRVVREVFAVKTVLISLIDHDRQWFKSRIGLDITETPRTISFCAHAILDTQPLIVEDTYNDLRFHDNPVVINNPQIRFYAGQPLFSEEGQPLGTLCLIDPAPRQLSDKQLRLFIDMAVLVEGYLKLRHVSAQTEQLRAALSREQRKTMLDPLTQLWNRAGLDHFLPRHQQQADELGLSLGVLFCDLDYFKKVNDNHGHAAGDQVLWETARRISAAVRPQDVVTRSGGEEFVVLLLVHDTHELLQIAERIRNTLSKEPVETDNQPLHLTISIGAALRSAGEPPSSTMKRADQALYQAKGNGRNRVEFAH